MESLYKQQIEKRIKNLTDWLSKNGCNCTKEQKHLDANTPEQVYWHYGYLMALKDVSRLIENETYELN